MDWQLLLKHLKEHGYEGDEKDLVAIKAYIADNTDGIEVDGNDVDIDALHAKAFPPKGKLDLSDAAREKSMADEVEARLESVLGRLGHPAAGEIKEGHEHIEAKDIKVGKTRLSEDPLGGFKSMGHFAFDVVRAGRGTGVTKALDTWNKASLGTSTFSGEQVGPDGGFAVPTEMSSAIREYTEGEDSILGRTDQIPISGNSIELPVDENTDWDTTDGIQANLTGEAQAIAQSKIDLKLHRLALRKVTALVPVTDELLEDAAAIAAYLPRKAGRKLDFKIGELLFRGNGAGEPLGFLNSDSVVSVTKESSQPNDTVVGSNVIKMYSRMYAPFRSDAVWFVQQDVEPQLMSMTFQTKTDAGTVVAGGGPIWLANSSVEGSPLNTLLGRPVIPTQHCATVGDVGDIIFASMKQYVVIRKAAGVDMQQSMHLWFDQAVQAFRFIFRLDGNPWSENTITNRSGSNALSAFITLTQR